MQAGALPSGPKLVIDPIPDNLVWEPIEYLFADHVRQRALCNLLKSLSDNSGTCSGFGFAETLVYLETEHPNHLADEEEELFPRLRACLGADRDVAELLERLEAEHRRERSLGSEVAEGLRRLAEGLEEGMPDRLRESIKAFVSGVTAHLSVEDERIIPLARSCLGDEDLDQMGRAMARRRGIEFPS